MGRNQKPEPTPEQRKVRNAFAANLAILIDYKFVRYRAKTRRYQETAKKLSTSLSQIQRLVAGTVGTSIDQLSDLAEFFQVDAWELLDPSFRARFSRDSNQPPDSQDPLQRHWR